jgi:hypothetical protein
MKIRDILFFSLLFNLGYATEVQVTDQVEGKTPLILGINTGEMPQGSAFPEWIRALGVNGARLRLNVAPEDTKSSNISSASDLEKKAQDLRNHAEKETPLLWQHPAKLTAESLRSLRESEIELLATITCPYSFKLLQPDGKTNWSNAWKFWEAYYAESYQLARQHQVCRYQLFNEPNHKDSLKLTQEEYAVRMAVGTDAIQAALTDTSKQIGTNLVSLISAPCTAGINVFTKTGKREARDDKIGWGELTMRDRHRRIGGKDDPSYFQFHQYAVQHYSTNPDSTLEKLRELQGQIQTANGGKELPLIMSEFNIHTARDFAKKETTMDSAEEFSDLGSMAVAIAESGMEELYFFRLTLSQNLDDGLTKKNGVHYVNESTMTPQITGTTKAAEVIRLVCNTLKGSRDRLKCQTFGDIRATATRQKDEVRVLLARTNSTSQAQIEATLPSSPKGSLATWEVVTGDSFGNITILPHETLREKIKVDLPSYSVGLLSVRPFNAVHPESLTATSLLSTARERCLTGGKDMEQALFSFPAAPAKKTASVFLHLQGKYAGTEPIPLHVYALRKESSGRAKFFFRRKKEMDGMSGLTVSGLGTDLDWVRGFTFASSQTEVWIEITDAISREAESAPSLIVTRDIRYNGEVPNPEPVEWTTAEIVSYPR